MRASGTFTVARFVPLPVAKEPPVTPVTTALPVGVAQMEKRYEGEVTGRSATLFTSAFDQESGVGSYVAMESFEGSLHGRSGTFNFLHSAASRDGGRAEEFFVIVASSGTEELGGIHGTGGLVVDADGTHRIWFDYGLA